VVFWAVFLLFTGLAWGYCNSIMNSRYFPQAFESGIVELPILAGLIYLNLYVLLPTFFVTKRYTFYLLLLLALFIITAILIRVLNVYYINVRYPSEWDNNHILDIYHVGKIMLLRVTPVFVVATVIKLLQFWHNEQKTARDLLKEKLDAELNYLKGQVHPHFLFNTLNNLYALTLQKSDQAPKIVLKLSELMSYMLYDSQENKIALQKELTHVQNYIDLEKIRYGNRLDVSFNISGDIKNRYIAPLILIPFIENAFKHGVSNETENCWITIDCKVKENGLMVKVENSKSNGVVSSDILHYKNGIGLHNVKRRLALLYPGNYELNIENSSEYYAVDLKLSLANN
jgi:two-component system, LytTR family, sensor kinase